MRTRHGIFEFLGSTRYGSVEPFIGLGLGYGSVKAVMRVNSETQALAMGIVQRALVSVANRPKP